jgi:protein subunit release factor B
MASDNHDALDPSAGVTALATASVGTGGQQVTAVSAAVTATVTATVGVYGTLTVDDR